MKKIMIKRGKAVIQMKLCMFLCLCLIAISSCISEGEETYVLEEPTLKASQMIIGGWKNSSVKVVDEDGNEVPDMGLGENIPDIPEISFDKDGNYTITRPDGTTDTGSWNISDDEEYLYLNDISWKIFSFGKNRLVILLEYKLEGRYYYIMFIFDKVSSPEEEGGDMPGIGDVSDNNPYKPWGENLVSKITLNRRYTDDNTYNKKVYLFRYDAKSRIIEYTEQTYNTVNNTVAREDKFNFIYDDTKVYLYCDGELVNTGIIGTNGYLTELYDGNSTKVNATFRYDSNGFVTYVQSGNQTWNPVYEYNNMVSPQTEGDRFSYGWDAYNNVSVDINGLVSTHYQWEWFMHLDYADIIWGLFDFYGKRSERIASTIDSEPYWTDQMTDFSIVAPGSGKYIPAAIQMTRTGLNDPFVADYTIEYVK